MTVVVTGASGLVGANLVRTLLEEGRNVRAMVHQDRRALEGLEIEEVAGDIRDPDSLYRAFDGAEVVYHLAAHISIQMDEWPLCEAVNVIGTRNVVNACLQTGVRRLIHCSSMTVFEQKPLDVPMDETRSLVEVESQDHPPYDRSKAGAEIEVRKGIEKGLDAVIVNPTGIVGPFDFRPSYMGEALIDFTQGNVPAGIAGGVDYVDVRDVVIGATRAEERAPSGSQYLLSGHWHSLPEFFAMLEEITGAPAPRVIIPMWLARFAIPLVAFADRRNGKSPRFTQATLRELQSNHNYNHQKATRDLDYHPRPLRETLTDTMRWFESTGQLDLPAKSSSN
jgi:dihydroflavonol-4-reductase